MVFFSLKSAEGKLWLAWPSHLLHHTLGI